MMLETKRCYDCGRKRKMTGNVFQNICELLTDHRWCKSIGYTETEPREFYWRCRICGKGFWNYGVKK